MARGHKLTSGFPNGTLIYLLSLSELIEFIPLGDSCRGNGFQRKWDLKRLQQIPRLISQGAVMLLKQGDFQKQQPAPSPSVTASGHSSAFSWGGHIHPFPSQGCQQDPEGKIRGVVAPSPAGGGQEVAGGLSQPLAPLEW